MSSELPDGAAGNGDTFQHEQVRLELALDCARMGAWDWELGPRTVTWDRQMHLLFGLKPGSFGGHHEDFLRLLHPADRARVTAEMASALEHCADSPHRTRAPYASNVRGRARRSTRRVHRRQ